MAIIRYTSFPSDLQRRTTDSAGVLNGKDASGNRIRSVESACQHLAAWRPVSCPATIVNLAIAAPSTIRMRLARGLYDKVAMSRPIFTALFEVDLQLDIVSGTDPVGYSIIIGVPSGNQIIVGQQVIAIGSGAAQAPGYDTVELTITPLTAGRQPRMLSWACMPMATSSPYQNTITV